MLRDRLKDKIYDYLKNNSILSKLDLKNNVYVTFLAQGEYNVNFIITDGMKKYVFRVNTGSQLELENQIKYEYDALRALEKSGVTPKVYYVDDKKAYFDYGILIMEFLEGRPLEYDKDLKKAANIFSRIHSLDFKKINRDHFIVEENIFSERILEARRLLKNFLVSYLVDPKLKRYFDNFLNWCEKHKNKEKYFIENKWHVINNTEVNSHNFIIGEKNNFLIDWEKPVISDPCQDLTQFLAKTTTLWKANYILSEEEIESFFQEYVNSLCIPDDHIRERVRLYTPYLYLRALSWCAYAWLEYQNPNKDIQNMDTIRKIEEYLDIEFMNGLLKEYNICG
ncbi:phosphotransferase [Crassaminicella thermophila]|uniref:Phosphotransferase n=1 Tax=Crassaminicella thermophila TaxID=2599308 RepID=A0A5C0SGA9_CRATE|nr:aminoglycoside phosphotransferase family protein [Crassaminicella thermophila]QEK12982.1 phosphotransferase [Crassaminicella thermophila]